VYLNSTWKKTLHLSDTSSYYMASPVSGQDESNPVLWLATRAGKMELSCPLGTTCHTPQEKFPRKPYNKSLIDQAYSVKMAGYWPCSFFASIWTSTPSWSINTQTKNLANIQPSWPHTWSITHTSFSRVCNFNFVYSLAPWARAQAAHPPTKYFDNNFETQSKYLGTQVIKCWLEMKLDENYKL